MRVVPLSHSFQAADILLGDISVAMLLKQALQEIFSHNALVLLVNHYLVIIGSASASVSPVPFDKLTELNCRLMVHIDGIPLARLGVSRDLQQGLTIPWKPRSLMIFA